MIFFILFIISLLSLLFLSYRVKQHQGKNILQIIQKSCSIDSVKFEKQILLLKKNIYIFLRKIFSNLKRIFHLLKTHINSMISQLKRSIRKKLFVSTQKENVSEFISEMKK